MSYTPGPWKWDSHGDLRGRDRNAIINPTLRKDVLSGVNREEDARLIAAAPDLLDALKAIDKNLTKAMRESAVLVEVSMAAGSARAAIAKATGAEVSA